MIATPSALHAEQSIAALERNGEAHEYVATQEARVTQLFQISTAQQHQITSAEDLADLGLPQLAGACLFIRAANT